MFWRRGNYESNTAEGIIAHVTQMSYNFWGTWFVGITANAVSSLKAHQIDTDDQMSSAFVCWDIPFESAKLCKASLLALEGFDFISDDESDFIDNTYPNSFIYMYGVINGHTIQHIYHRYSSVCSSIVLHVYIISINIRKINQFFLVPVRFLK